MDIDEKNHHRLGQDARKYDSKDGIGRVESGTETENNAGAIVEARVVVHGLIKVNHNMGDGYRLEAYRHDGKASDL